MRRRKKTREWLKKNGKSTHNSCASLCLFNLSACLSIVFNVYIFLHSSMTASPTATNHAMLFSSGPKVTARWCCQPTNYQLHLKQNVKMSEHLILAAAHDAHNNLLLKSYFIIALCSFLRKCFATSPAHAVPPLFLSVNPPDTLSLVPVVSPGVNTGGVGSYIYEKEPSAVTQPWTFLSPQLHPSSLHNTDHQSQYYL